jgi:hypothetical protein
MKSTKTSLTRSSALLGQSQAPKTRLESMNLNGKSSRSVLNETMMNKKSQKMNERRRAVQMDSKDDVSGAQSFVPKRTFQSKVSELSLQSPDQHPFKVRRHNHLTITALPYCRDPVDRLKTRSARIVGVESINFISSYD